MVCEYCANDIDEELTLAPVETLVDAGKFHSQAAAATLANTQEVHLEPLDATSTLRCRKCQVEIPVGSIQCPACGFNPQLARAIDPLELDEFEGAMGFQRFLMRHTSNNDPTNLVLWLRVFLAFVLAVYIVTTRNFSSIVISVLVGCGYVFYLSTLGRPASFYAGRSLVPRVILLVNRLNGWSSIARNPKKEGAIVTSRGGQFSDDRLAGLDNPGAVEVLDIPGATVTDLGILYLQNFTSLKALVIQDCNVSNEAIEDLQRRNKALLIWR
tara:strand:- start:16219 stop:17028 length:810 start_codon:yes stop_codon:yes gene_type:complete